MCNFKVMVYSASISKSVRVYMLMCIRTHTAVYVWFFSMEKSNTKEHSSAMGNWRQRNLSQAEAVVQDWTVRHKSDKGENCQGRQLRRKEDFTVTEL